MEIKNIENMISHIENRVLKLEGRSRAILDISVYPELSRILEIKKSNFYPTYYFPDTIVDLLLKAKANDQYYYFMTRLFTRWTQRYIDFKILDKIFVKKEFPQAKIELITKEMIDMKVYSFCCKNFVSKDLVIELSPEFNLVGDIIGKILGFAKKSETPILMMNQRLVRYAKKLIPVFETANMFVDEKQRFFRKFIPHLENTRGIRWLIGITVGIAVNPVGFVFMVVDP